MPEQFPAGSADGDPPSPVRGAAEPDRSARLSARDAVVSLMIALPFLGLWVVLLFAGPNLGVYAPPPVAMDALLAISITVVLCGVLRSWAVIQHHWLWLGGAAAVFVVVLWCLHQFAGGYWTQHFVQKVSACRGHLTEGDGCEIGFGTKADGEEPDCRPIKFLQDGRLIAPQDLRTDYTATVSASDGTTVTFREVAATVAEGTGGQYIMVCGSSKADKPSSDPTKPDARTTLTIRGLFKPAR